MNIPLSILDLVPLPEGASSTEALRNSLELARLADRLGYTRYWFAEHHNMPTVVSTTPEIMIALAAEQTGRLRVGSGGVMLPNHTPLKVAETYKMLAALHPGRIDLGIGRAPGTDTATAVALRGSRQAVMADDFMQQLSELEAFGKDGMGVRNSSATVAAMPPDAPLPGIWLLGSSDYSAQLAAAIGVGYAFAAHFSDFPPQYPLRAYRDQFKPGTLERPHAILTLSVICADTDAEAERLASSLLVAFTRLRTGQKSILLTPDEARAYPFTAQELAVAETIRPQQIIGSPETVEKRIRSLVERTGADEVMVTTFTHGQTERLHSYELLAEAFALQQHVL
ncbi:MAG: LLM class flavin-dependent oxidoreductase [Fibrella sp.]|nr:LLM class flavin-dependent oxidoreductase [Armatimonadota bacterium]